MFANQDFIFAGEKSRDYGVSIVRTDSGLFGVPLTGSRNISEEYLPYVDIPHFYKTNVQPFEFTLMLSLLDEEWTSDQIEKITRWLMRRGYQDFQTTDNMAKVYKIIAKSEVQLMTSGDYKGYTSITFQSLPYSFSPVQISTFDCTSSTPATIEITNKSNIFDIYNTNYYEPEIWVDLSGISRSITLINHSDGGRAFSITGLSDSESLYINNKKKYIVSSTGNERIAGLYNYQWFRMVYGVNRIEVTEGCTLQLKCQFPMIF